MATVIRAVISEKNKYWISKHRHYELKHFCLQYPVWKKKYQALSELSVSTSLLDTQPNSNILNDITAAQAVKKTVLSERIDLIEKTAKEADNFLYPYILKAVTEGLSYTYLRTTLNIPCGRDLYYDRYRRFFWLLSRKRG